ncbi:MAG: hypothetical protein AB9873_14670 [Syntrophobacteraceae bacterium]
MFRLKIFATWMALLACFCMAVEYGAGLTVCYANSGHVAVEPMAQASCAPGLLPDSFSPGHSMRELVPSSMIPEGCCGPCFDTSLWGTHAFPIPLSDPHSTVLSQLLAVEPDSLNPSVIAPETRGIGSTAFFPQPSSRIASLRSTILLI